MSELALAATNYPAFFTSPVFVMLFIPVGIGVIGVLMTGIAQRKLTIEGLLSLSSGLTMVALGSNFSFFTAAMAPSFLSASEAASLTEEKKAIGMFMTLVITTILFAFLALFIHALEDLEDARKFGLSTAVAVFSLSLVGLGWQL